MSATRADDNNLIAEIVDGDKTAMRALVEKYKRKAYFLALGMVGNSDEAMDISQEAFIRVFKSAKKFDQKQKFFPWFYSIIANLCKNDLQRREKRDSKAVDLEESDFLLVDEGNPETKLIRKEEAAMIRKALSELSFEDREIIVLKHFRDMSYDEIAKLLNIPKGTVMSRLYYARKKLAKLCHELR
ncbi:MAG: RNA polymerase subunit sigma-24 [Candidatus Zixiibacteriota bacterium]|nr:MAG: RNA polymerase subunit sigma-24 [candidate division Zixibacteria bacterium]HDL04184.1 sigma-70 family RNA polymerase sigma factor [candidate division Zixibacteria bacterium]